MAFQYSASDISSRGTSGDECIDFLRRHGWLWSAVLDVALRCWLFCRRSAPLGPLEQREKIPSPVLVARHEPVVISPPPTVIVPMGKLPAVQLEHDALPIRELRHDLDCGSSGLASTVCVLLSPREVGDGLQVPETEYLLSQVQIEVGVSRQGFLPI